MGEEELSKMLQYWCNIKIQAKQRSVMTSYVLLIIALNQLSYRLHL